MTENEEEVCPFEQHRQNPLETFGKPPNAQPAHPSEEPSAQAYGREELPAPVQAPGYSSSPNEFSGTNHPHPPMNPSGDPNLGPQKLPTGVSDPSSATSLQKFQKKFTKGSGSSHSQGKFGENFHS